MKPGYALSFTMDGVSLLQRAAGGWRTVGNVTLGDGDPEPALREMRQRAEVVGPAPLACKLVLPNEQIRYLTVDTGITDADTRLAAVQEALTDATPYALNELAYDLCPDGPLTHVAAVAIETLGEAEGFAAANGFLPVCFVAAPGDNAYLGEPFFGTTRAIRGTEVEPDGIAVVVIGDAELPTVATEVEADLEAVADSGDQAAPEDTQPKELAAAETAAEENSEPAATEAEPSDPADIPQPPAASLKTDADADADADADGAKTPAGDASTPDTSNDGDVTETDTSAAAPALASGSTTSAVPDAQKDAGSAALNEPPVTSFTSRRRKKAGAADIATAVPLTGASASSVASLKPTGIKPVGTTAERGAPPPLGVPTAGTKPAAAAAALPPSVAGIRPKPARAAATANPQPFPDPKLGRSGKPRFLGLALTAGLLLTMAVIALWTLWAPQSPEPEVTQFSDSAVPSPDQPALPDTGETVEDEAAAADIPDSVETASAGESADNQEAALAPTEPTEVPDSTETAQDSTPDSTQATTAEAIPETASEPDGALAEPAADTIADTVANSVLLDADPADKDLSQAALYAATGVWSTAPDGPEVPQLIRIGDLALASVSQSSQTRDAPTLSTRQALTTDTAPVRQQPPVAANSELDLDERGLVKATPEGTLNQDGILIFLGAPSLVPPPGPAREDPAAEAAQAAADRRAVLAGKRPRLRPENLTASAAGETETDADTETGADTETDAEEPADPAESSAAADSRPRIRPANLTTPPPAAEAPATQTAALTIRPRVRPAKLAAPRSTTAANPPAVTVPSLPTSASVARQATQENALNLRKLNLIGVFGSSSDRRALVRLPSGGYRNLKVGDRLDGGRVVAIGESELRYQKGGRNLTLRIPNG